MKRLLAIAIGFAACDKRPAAPPRPADDPAAAAAQRPKDDRADPCSKARVEAGQAMAWIHDDLPAALACAKLHKVPVVLDLWAPWCHTCLSMQSTVFTDRSLAPEAERFVFAALDTDKEVNADAVAKYPPSAWPTFYVIGNDPASGRSDAVLARFVGAASVEQFRAFLEAGRRAQAGGAAGADAHLLGAERATAVKDLATAEQELTAALASAPADWTRRPDVLTSLISTKRRRKDLAGCFELAEKSLDATGNAAAATDFIVSAMACAAELKSDRGYADRVTRLRERAAARLTALVDDATAATSPMSVDDRSDALANLRELQDLLGKRADAKATAERQRALLDDAAGKAPTAMAAMTYNYQRAEVYAYLGRPLDIVPALEKSARDLPTEYDPRARLGGAYLRAGKLVEAAQWTDEALRLVYGPRKARVLSQRADIAKQQRDGAAERLFRREIVKLWETMPAGQANPDALARAREELAALDAGGAPAAAPTAPAASTASAGSAAPAAPTGSAGSAGSAAPAAR